MQDNNKEKPLTVSDFYETMLPAMKEVLTTKDELAKFRNETLTSFDRVFNDLEVLKLEKTMGYEQKKRERKLWSIMIEAMQEHKILSAKDVEQIQALDIF